MQTAVFGDMASLSDDPFVYTRAVVCGVPASLPQAALRTEDAGEPISLDKARHQHEEYVRVCSKQLQYIHR